MRVLVTGASGSGTSTLGRAVAERTGWVHFDADDYFWLPTAPPFAAKRDRAERLRLLLFAITNSHAAIVSGSVMDWGAELEDSFRLIAFLTVPAAVRLERLRLREVARLDRVDEAFFEWAAQYDEGRLDGRSLAKHLQWLSKRSCPVLRIDGEVPLANSSSRVLEAMAALSLITNVSARTA